VPKMAKSPPALVEAFDGALPDDPRVQRRPMFGYPVAWVGGNMFVGLFADQLWVRVPPDARAELGGTSLEPMPGRPMRDYTIVPPALIADPTALRGWVSRALNFTASLPPKEKKPAKPKKAR
jgi:hypothetical protein